MAIKVSSKKCFTVSQKRSWQKLANYVSSHYPKDGDLHKSVRGAFKAIDDAATKMRKDAAKTAKKRAKPKRRSARRAAPGRPSAKRRMGRKRKAA